MCAGCGALLGIRAGPLWWALGVWGAGMLLLVAGMVRGAAWPRFAGDALAAVGVLTMLLRWRPALLASGPCCPRCHYDLSGIPPDAPCPECGWPRLSFGS